MTRTWVFNGNEICERSDVAVTTRGRAPGVAFGSAAGGLGCAIAIQERAVRNRGVCGTPRSIGDCGGGGTRTGP